MNFDVDVSGEDILSKNYTVCIANKDSLIKGFKFNEELISILCSKYGNNLYKYKKSRKEKSLFKVRLYSIILYYLLKYSGIKGELSLNICRDFNGREEDIKQNLRFFLNQLPEIQLRDRIYFVQLDKGSNAHKYAYLMRVDDKNKMNTYIGLNLGDIERWLKK